MENYSEEIKGQRLSTIPGSNGLFSGKYKNDFHGTWYEVELTDGGVVWVIGEPKE